MHTSVRQLTSLATTAAGTAFAVFLWSPGAFAFADCDDTQPGVGQVVLCTDGLGANEVDIPERANAVEIIAIGGGGGGGGAGSENGANGGAGARIEGTFTLPSGISKLATSVAERGDGSPNGGRGGAYSYISYNDPSTGNLTFLVLAGGGGGGGGGAPTAVGGDGADGGELAGGPGSSGASIGGRGGSGGTGGSGGNGDVSGESGEALVLDGGSDVGRGGDGGGSGAEGGAGYGGGGGGGETSSTTGGGGAGGSYVNQSYLVDGTQLFRPADDEAGNPGFGGTGGIAPNAAGQDGQPGIVALVFRILLPPDAGASSVSEPATATVSFILPSIISCSFDAVEASSGAWVQLPDAGDCMITTRTTDSQPTLLGWATNADFPIDIAQRQVNNGWGAYETFNSDGQITGVFIPAGGYTLVSNDTNLHPIWEY